jgi:hypothetical protein
VTGDQSGAGFDAVRLDCIQYHSNRYDATALDSTWLDSMGRSDSIQSHMVRFALIQRGLTPYRFIVVPSI